LTFLRTLDNLCRLKSLEQRPRCYYRLMPFSRMMKEEHDLLWDMCLELESALAGGPENATASAVVDKIKKTLGEPHVYGGGEYVSGWHG